MTPSFGKRFSFLFFIYIFLIFLQFYNAVGHQ